MKIANALLVVALVVCAARPVLAQTEKIALYADAGGSDCSITDTAPGVVEVHIIHVGSPGSTAVSFRAPTPACWTGAVWLGDFFSQSFVVYGDTHWDFLDIGYRACLVSPIHILRMNFFASGMGNPCCEYPVMPGSEATIVSVDCQQPFGNAVAIGGGKVTINENESCLCDPPLAVEETTWGAVKALYR